MRKFCALRVFLKHNFAEKIFSEKHDFGCKFFSKKHDFELKLFRRVRL